MFQARARLAARRRPLLTAAAVAALLAPAIASPFAVAAQEATFLPATAQAAPADAVAFMSLDLDESSDQWQQMQELLDRMGLPTALDEVRAGILADQAPDGSQLSEADLDALFGGEMGVVVTQQAVENLAGVYDVALEAMATPEADLTEEDFATPLAGIAEEGFGVAAVLQPGDLDGAWDYVQRQLETAATDAGTTVTETDYDGTTIYTVPSDDIYGMDAAGDLAPGGMDDGAADEAADEDAMAGMEGHGLKAEIAVAQVEDFIVAGASAADLEPLIDAATGGDNLAADEDFAATRQFFANDALAFAYVDSTGLTDAIGPDLTAALTDLYTQYYGAETAETYLSGIQAGIAIWADEPGLRVDTVSMATEGDLPPMVPDAGEVTFAENVPAGALIYAAGFNPRAVLDQVAASIAQTVNQIDAMESGETPETAQSLDDVAEMLTPEYQEEQLAQAEEIIGFNLRTDLFDNLTGEYGFAFGAPNLASGGFDVDLILALATSDGDALAEQTQRLARFLEQQQDAPDITAGAMGEDTVYTISAEEMAGVPPFGFGVVDDQLVAGTMASIEALGSTPASTLADDAQFQTVTGLLPDDYYQIGYIDLGQIIPLALAFSGMGGMDAGMGGADADPACAAYPDQEEAQLAFDDDPFANSSLDSDFDGEACEDFYGSATPAAGSAPAGGPENVKALAAVAWERDGMMGSNTILYVTESGS
jgi:hypothetical protein